MADRVRIEFRGVCLFVPSPRNRLVRVLMPLTEVSLPNMNRHHAYLTIYDAKDSPIDAPAPLTRQALRISSAAIPREFAFPRLLNVKSLVNEPMVGVITNPVPGRDVEALVTVHGGASWSTGPKSDAGWVRHDTAEYVGRPDLQAVWEEAADQPVTIHFASGRSVDVQPGETAVIGYYDQTQHATDRHISPRSPTWDHLGGANDDDFRWLYSLLAPSPRAKPVPRTYAPAAVNVPTALNVPGLLKPTPLTTTCFGGTWEPEE